MTLPTLPPLALPDLDVQVRSIPAAQYDIDRVRGVVEALVMPYERPAEIVEALPGPDGKLRVVEYREQFVSSAFERARSAPRKVGLTFTHSEAMPDRMGYGLELRDDSTLNGAVMTWQLYPDTLDRSVALLTSTHDGMSVSFRSLKPTRGTERNGAFVTREAVHLTTVAATDDPAYIDTRVLAIRERQQLLAEEQQRTSERANQYVDGLLLLRSYGRALTPAQESYLAEHGHAPTP